MLGDEDPTFGIEGEIIGAVEQRIARCGLLPGGQAFSLR
jgi:hypothetical protein